MGVSSVYNKNDDTLEVDSFCHECYLALSSPVFCEESLGMDPMENWERLAVDQGLHHVRIDLN